MDLKLYCSCCGMVLLGELCGVCGHIQHSSVNKTIRYEDQIDRNALPVRYVKRKFMDRLNEIKPYVSSGMKLLEIGCAEGMLGQEIKALAQLTYYGIEPSHDGERARFILDAVYHNIDEIKLGEERFDGILAFHVLE